MAREAVVGTIEGRPTSESRETKVCKSISANSKNKERFGPRLSIAAPLTVDQNVKYVTPGVASEGRQNNFPSIHKSGDSQVINVKNRTLDY